MPTRDNELAVWNEQASEFLLLSPGHQEIYIAAVNAGADPAELLEALGNEGLLDVLSASGIDPIALVATLPPEAFEAVAEGVSCFVGF
jgi:hypothetical protein